MAADLPPGFEPYAGETVPQAPAGAPGKDGRLELDFARAEGKTCLVREFARAPFHVSGTLDHDPLAEAATVYVQSPTGGVAQGDRRSVEVTVGPDAVAGVANGSATKVFSMEANYARTDVSLSVGARGHLEYVPGTTILHADARLCRSLTLEVAPDASAVLGEVIVPGRLARGEAFAFDRYVSRVRIRGPDGLLAEDATRLQPADWSPRAPGVLGDATVLGTLFVVAPAADGDRLTDAVHERIAGVDGASADGSAAGATALPNDAGAVVRVLGDTAEDVRERLRAAWDRARRDLLGAPAPPRRK
jgi:urease accessory protein